MEIETARLLLRPPAPTDASGALAMLLDPETRRWNPAAEVVDVATAEDWCARMADWSAGGHATFHALDASTGSFVGYVSVFSIDPEHRTARVGYRIAPASRGHRFGAEALRAVTAWAFESLALERIQLEHAVGNPASCAVATSAGYRLEGVLRSSFRAEDGSRHDEHVHGRLATDAG